jgi:hypothetical protein
MTRRARALGLPLMAVAIAALLAALMAACGASGGGAGAASATATCPPATAFKSVRGTITAATITAASGGALTVTDATGTKTTVNVGANTRVTKLTALPASGLAAGQSVQVITDTNVTTAQRIMVLPSGSTGFGGGGFGGFRGTATPGTGARAGRNAGCFARQRQGQGSGQAGGFQGLRGTIDTASSTRIVLDDPQGQTFTVAVTPGTVIVTSAAGTLGDLTVGATVTAAGSAASGGINARTVTVQA